MLSILPLDLTIQKLATLQILRKKYNQHGFLWALINFPSYHHHHRHPHNNNNNNDNNNNNNNNNNKGSTGYLKSCFQSNILFQSGNLSMKNRGFYVRNKNFIIYLFYLTFLSFNHRCYGRQFEYFVMKKFSCIL